MDNYKDIFKELIDWKVFNYLVDKTTKYQDMGRGVNCYVFVYVADTDYSKEFSLNNDHMLLKSDSNSDVIWFTGSLMSLSGVYTAYKCYERICYGIYLNKPDLLNECKNSIKVNGYVLISETRYIAVYEKIKSDDNK